MGISKTRKAFFHPLWDALCLTKTPNSNKHKPANRYRDPLCTHRSFLTSP
jgi:hypothetical protein